MKTLRIKRVDYVFIIEAGVVYNLVFENPRNLYRIINNIKDNNTDEIILYQDKILDFGKEVCLITDVFELNLNTKKSLSVTYKNIENDYIADEQRIILADINSNIIKLLDQISHSYDMRLEYNSNISFSDIFNMTSLKCSFNKESFVDDFVNYVKNVKINNDIRILFVLNLFDFITIDEFNLIIKELEYMNICLFNISGHYKPFKVNKTIIIDEDLCRIC